tara:strand:- start:305 stop:496 length:192 start_codon:yes stop_codon:yes gene_type:complete
MLIIPVIHGNLNKALKLFKRKFRDTKIIKEVRERKSYTKPTTKRRLAKEKSILKQKFKLENDE